MLLPTVKTNLSEDAARKLAAKLAQDDKEFTYVPVPLGRPQDAAFWNVLVFDQDCYLGTL